MEIDLFEIDYYYINLEEHSDRRNSIVEKLTTLGIPDSRITRINGIRADGIPQDSVFRGCFMSQLEALKKARKFGVPFIIVEDDIEINSFERIVEIPDDSHCIYLGLSSWGFSPSKDSNLASLNSIITDNVNRRIARIFNMLSSHAIMYIDMGYVDELILGLEHNLAGGQIKSPVEGIGMKYFGGNLLPCDIVMATKQYHNNVYALRNPIFYQDGKHEYCTLIKI